MILLVAYLLTHKNIHQNVLQKALSARVIMVHDFVCVILLNSNTSKSPLEGTVTPRINTCRTIRDGHHFICSFIDLHLLKRYNLKTGSYFSNNYFVFWYLMDMYNILYECYVVYL